MLRKMKLNHARFTTESMRTTRAKQIRSAALAVRKGTFLLSFLFSRVYLLSWKRALSHLPSPEPLVRRLLFFSTCFATLKRRIFISFMYENANHRTEKWASVTTVRHWSGAASPLLPFRSHQCVTRGNVTSRLWDDSRTKSVAEISRVNFGSPTFAR